MIRRLHALPPDAMHLGLMLALTFGTGIIDAVGYLGLDRVFTGNMTGNVVILGMALVGGDNLPVLGPVVALAGFMAGAALGGRVLVKAGPGWTHRTTTLFSIVALTMLALAAALLVVDEVEQWLAMTVTTLLGASMGVQAATARFIGVKDVTTVVVTSTITGMAADSVLGAGKSGGSGRRVAAVLLILLGAAAGALLLKADVAWGLIASGLLVAGVTAIGALHAHHHPRVRPLADGQPDHGPGIRRADARDPSS